MNRHAHSYDPPPAGWDWPRLRAIALTETRRVLRDPDRAQDAAQDALVRAWRHAARLHSDEPGPWVRTIARREALRAHARHAGREAPLEALPDEPAADVLRERHAALDVRGAVAALPAADRRMLFEHYWGDRPVREIAADLGMPEGTVKIRMHRSRRRLEAELPHLRADV